MKNIIALSTKFKISKEEKKNNKTWDKHFS